MFLCFVLVLPPRLRVRPLFPVHVGAPLGRRCAEKGMFPARLADIIPPRFPLGIYGINGIVLYGEGMAHGLHGIKRMWRGSCDLWNLWDVFIVNISRTD